MLIEFCGRPRHVAAQSRGRSGPAARTACRSRPSGLGFRGSVMSLHVGAAPRRRRHARRLSAEVSLSNFTDDAMTDSAMRHAGCGVGGTRRHAMQGGPPAAPRVVYRADRTPFAAGSSVCPTRLGLRYAWSQSEIYLPARIRVCLKHTVRESEDSTLADQEPVTPHRMRKA